MNEENNNNPFTQYYMSLVQHGTVKKILQKFFIILCGFVTANSTLFHSNRWYPVSWVFKQVNSPNSTMN